MVMRVVGRRVRRKAAGGAVLDPLIDRQDQELAGAAELAVHQDAGEVRLGPGIVALVMAEDLLDLTVDLHRGVPSWQAVDVHLFSKTPAARRGSTCSGFRHR